MNYTFVGRGIVVTDALKNKTESKLDKLERYLGEDTSVNVTFSVVKLMQKVEVTIRMPKRTLRAEVADEDMYVAIDKVVDILERQLRKYKTRLQDKSQRDKRYGVELADFAELTALEEELLEDSVIKVKSIDVKPMTVDEAILEMDLIGHNFYVYTDGNTDSVSVVYKRNDGGYGVIETK